MKDLNKLWHTGGPVELSPHNAVRLGSGYFKVFARVR